MVDGGCYVVAGGEGGGRGLRRRWGAGSASPPATLPKATQRPTHGAQGQRQGREEICLPLICFPVLSSWLRRRNGRAPSTSELRAMSSLPRKDRKKPKSCSEGRGVERSDSLYERASTDRLWLMC